MTFRRIALALAVTAAISPAALAQQHDHQHGAKPAENAQPIANRTVAPADPAERCKQMRAHMASMRDQMAAMHDQMGQMGDMRGMMGHGQDGDGQEHHPMGMMYGMMGQMMDQHQMLMDMVCDIHGKSQ